MEEILIGQTRLTLTQGDITQADTEAIVNAANSRLAGGGGVDGAIHRAGGPQIMEECRRIGHCPTGSAVITTGGRLKAKIIHTVGPIFSGNPRDAQLLASAYRSSLELAARYVLRRVAFPSISTGAYGYPLAQAADVALDTVKLSILAHGDAFDEVRFVLFGDESHQAYRQALARLG